MYYREGADLIYIVVKAVSTLLKNVSSWQEGLSCILWKDECLDTGPRLLGIHTE